MIFHCEYNHILLSHSSIDRHLGQSCFSHYAQWCYCSLYKSLFETLLQSFQYISRCGLAGSYGNSIFNFFRNHCTVFSIVAVPYYITTNSGQMFQFLHFLPTLVMFNFIDKSHPNGCEVVSQSFALHFPNDQRF